MKRGFVRLEKTSSDLMPYHNYYRISTADILDMPLEKFDVVWPEDAADAVVLIFKVLGLGWQDYNWDAICDAACKLPVGNHIDYVTDPTIYKEDE